jgi:hypothetical protein
MDIYKCPILRKADSMFEKKYVVTIKKISVWSFFENFYFCDDKKKINKYFLEKTI